MKRLIGVFLCAVLVLGTAFLPAQAFGTDLRYCRDAMSELSNGEALLHAYDSILAGYLDFEKDIEIDSDYGLVYSDIVSVSEAIRCDCPELLWQSDSFSVSVKGDGTVVGIHPNYSYTKEKADALFKELGMNISTAFNIFIRQALREGRIPFEISLNSILFVAFSSSSKTSARCHEMASPSLSGSVAR